MDNIVNPVEDKIQNAVLSAKDCIHTPKIKLATRSLNATSGRDATSVLASSESGQKIRITAPPENVSEKNNTLHVLNIRDETRSKLPDDVIELSVPGTHFDRQSYAHHMVTRQTA